MERNGTAILLDVKLDGADLILVVDHEKKIVSLVQVTKSGMLAVRGVRDYTRIGVTKPTRRKK